MPRPPTQEPRPPPTAIPTADAADAPLTPSKSQRKRDAHALQALGVQLVALSATQLPAFSANTPPAHDRDTGWKSSPGAGLRVGAGVHSAP